MDKIAVFCGSKMGSAPELVSHTEKFAQVLAKENIELIYGGAQSGLMGVLADSVLESGGKVTGVMPVLLEGKERVHSGLTQLIEVEDMQTRKQTMLSLSDGVVALPGGTGTLDELFEVLSLSQIGSHHKPCGVLNMQGYFDGLISFLRHMRDSGFLHPDYFDMLIVESDPELLLQKMNTFAHPHHQ